MIGKKELAISNLYRYFYAISEKEKVELKLEELETSVGYKSPNFSGEVVGYSGTKDEKLLRYSIKKGELEKEKDKWVKESEVYYYVLHLYELTEEDMKFLKLKYQCKLSGEEISKQMPYTNRMYVKRKDEKLLERLSKFV